VYHTGWIYGLSLRISDCAGVLLKSSVCKTISMQDDLEHTCARKSAWYRHVYSSLRVNRSIQFLYFYFPFPILRPRLSKTAFVFTYKLIYEAYPEYTPRSIMQCTA
jgi:hypothetical protein